MTGSKGSGTVFGRNDMPVVRLKDILRGVDDDRRTPDAIAANAALGCFEERTVHEIFEADHASLDEAALRKRQDSIFRESSGRGHGSVLDQSRFRFEIEGLPRSATMFLAQPQFMELLQQSQRRTVASDLYVPGSLEDSALAKRCRKVMESAFSLYQKMVDEGIPEEDARFLLPLNIRTNTSVCLNARELMHLHSMSREQSVPGIITYTVQTMIDEARRIAPLLMKERPGSYEQLAWFPSARLFAQHNRTPEELIGNCINTWHQDDAVLLLGNAGIYVSDASVKLAVEARDEAELANLKHIHFTFLAAMSLVTAHHALRQRTWDQSIEPIYHAAARGAVITPRKISSSSHAEAYGNIAADMVDMFLQLARDSSMYPSEAVGFLPQALIVYDLIHVNGWNAIHSIGKRTCREAQWEIRQIAQSMANKISVVNPPLGRYAVPQGVIYGRCPEKKSCGVCEKEIKNRQRYGRS